MSVYTDYLKALQMKALAGGAIQGAGNLAQGYIGGMERQYVTRQEQEKARQEMLNREIMEKTQSLSMFTETTLGAAS